jgi:hypothetical protein
MRPDEHSTTGAEGVMWDALLANLDEDDRKHAQQRVWQSIEEDRARARRMDDASASRPDGDDEP